MTENQEILARLFALQDVKYGDFHSKLVPGLARERIIGVRTPALRKLAAELSGCEEGRALARDFLACLPHQYYEENNLHGLLIGRLAQDAAEALALTDRFLPYVDNWATCDLLPPKIFQKDLPLVRKTITPWLASGQTYRVRFAIVTMLSFMLEKEFAPDDLTLLANLQTEEYYINMAIAWYYSFALIKQYEQTIGIFEAQSLGKWVHNKSIQKALESYRIPPERKEYLRSLRRK